MKKICWLIFAAFLTSASAAQAQKPNIVVILTDDLDQLLGTLNYTPNINRLLRDGGISFSRAFVTNSVCCPSRSTLLRGQYTHSHRVYTNSPPNGSFLKFVKLREDTSTIAVWLQRAGYATSLMGKYLNGYSVDYLPPGWNDWHVAANGYPEFNYRLNDNGKINSYGSDSASYLTDVLRARALDFIKANAKKPFYLEIATFAPHGPATPAPRHANLFMNLENPQRKRVQSMQAVDEMVVALFDQLRAERILNNTYLFFTSDNGFHYNQHGLKPGKQTAYEEDIRVPLFVVGPGIKPGSKSDAIVGNVDFAQTFADIAGIAVPDFVEGRSLLPLLHGARPADWRKAMLLENYLGNKPDTQPIRRRARVNDRVIEPRYMAIRTTTHTYIEWRNGDRMLFDLTRDSAENNNIADQQPELVKQLSDWVHRLHACSGAACRSADK